MKRRQFIFMILFFIVFLAACSGAGNTDVPVSEEKDLKDQYQKLLDSAASFSELNSGILTVDMNYVQRYIDILGKEDNEYDAQHTTTVNYQKREEGYDFIQIIRQADQELPSGLRQKDGIGTQYVYQPYDDGTFEWREGAASLDQYELPQEAQLFYDIPELSMIDAITSVEEGKLIKYTLLLDESYFDFAEQNSQNNGYELQECNMSYYVDKNGMLARVIVERKEFWIYSEVYDVEQMHLYDISLSGSNEPVDMDYFKKNQTYTKPLYTDITEVWREEYINIPETYIFDVRIPKLKEDLPNAEKINAKIAADCSIELSATEEDLISEAEWGGYPWHTTDFAVYKFDQVYEICIFNSEASAWGSGIGMWIYTYYYDASIEDEISAEDFLEKAGYTREEIVEIFYRDYLGEMGEGEAYTYDEISDWYYFDEAGHVQFYVNLFG